MQHDSQERYTRIFVILLLLAGFLYSISKGFPWLINDFLGVVVHSIYTGLLLLWIYSVRQRLLPTCSRRYLLMAGVLMLFHLLLRLTRYRTPDTSVLLLRYLWYIFYMPMILVPTLFAMSCLRMRRAGTDEKSHPESLLLLPALLLVLLVLTNDLHKLVFFPRLEMEALAGEDGTYTWMPLFYLVYGWIGLMFVAGILALILLRRKKASAALPGRGLSPLRREENVYLLPFLPMAVWGVLVILYFMIPRSFYPYNRFYNMQEIHIFCMLGVLEACIRTRLIPYNANYTLFFRTLKISAAITDRGLKAELVTDCVWEASREQMELSLKEAVYPAEDRRLSNHPVQGGYAFWIHDESLIRHLNERLTEANETIALENEMLERENSLIQERVGTEERSRLYAKAAREVYPAQRRIAKLLSRIKPDTLEFRDRTARVLLLTAYVKRKANFVMLEAEREEITGEELASALKESAHYLGYC